MEAQENTKKDEHGPGGNREISLMPLLPGKKNIGYNISEMESAGHPRNQAIAAALDTARKHRDSGGLNKLVVPHIHRPKIRAPRAFRYTRHHTGPIHSSVAGRTDHLPMTVPTGSYVLPADIISGSGEGNTIAGFKHARRAFGGNPYGGGAQPYGHTGGPYGMAAGGKTDDDPGVPIVAAGGEYVLHPDEVREVGGGDLDTGHKVLDEFVKRMRKDLIGTLKKLPGPSKN
jgi:hypothetical protein